MSQAAAYSVIHRKAKVAREEFDAREMSPAKALRLSMAKTAETLLRLALVVRTVEQTTVPLQQMEESLGAGGGLLIVLDGSDGLRGAVKLDHPFVSGLIEVQLLGQLRERLPDMRPFTPTDAAITQPLINEMLRLFHEMLAEEEIESRAECLRFGDMVEDARSLVLGLEAPDYEFYRLNVDLGPGKRTGQMELYLPHRPARRNWTETGAGGGLSHKLERAATTAPVLLDAALTRLRLPLHDVLTWTPGTTLAIDHGALNDGVLLGSRNHEVARFKLGQLEGFRAVQLISEATPEDVEEPQTEAEEGPDTPPETAQITLSSDLEGAGDLPAVDTDLSGIGDDAAMSEGEEGWPALGGLDDISDDLDDILQDIPEEDFTADLPTADDGGDGDFAPLPMMVADIDLDD